MIITYIIREDGEQMYNEAGQPLGKFVLGLRGMLVWLAQLKPSSLFSTMLSSWARRKRGPG